MFLQFNGKHYQNLKSPSHNCVNYLPDYFFSCYPLITILVSGWEMIATNVRKNRKNTILGDFA